MVLYVILILENSKRMFYLFSIDFSIFIWKDRVADKRQILNPLVQPPHNHNGWIWAGQKLGASVFFQVCRVDAGTQVFSGHQQGAGSEVEGAAGLNCDSSDGRKWWQSKARSSETFLGHVHNLGFAITWGSWKVWNGEWECLSQDDPSFQNDVLLFSLAAQAVSWLIRWFSVNRIGRTCLPGSAVHY